MDLEVNWKLISLIAKNKIFRDVKKMTVNLK
jgi:hypothetical protein